MDRELERVRKLDYAFDNEEAEKGGSCIGSGTYDDKGRQVAGHSLSAPSNRMDKAWGPWVKEVAEEIFRALEYRAGVKAA